MFSNHNRSPIGSALWAPWSTCVWGMTLSWMGFLAATSAPLTLFRPFESFQMKWPNRQLAWALRFSFSNLTVHFDEDFDPTRVSVFAQNHISVLDGVIAAGAIPVPVCGIENAAHLRLPGYGWLLKLNNAIPVRPGAKRYEEIAEAVRERASRGISVLAFPEGHRTLNGKVQPFRRGVFRIARAAGLPIVPLCVRGAYHMLPKGAFTLRPAKIEVYVAPQVETEGMTDEQLDVAMERMQEAMNAWIDKRERCGRLDLT